MDFCASYHTHNDGLAEYRYPLSALDTMIEKVFSQPSKKFILEVLSLPRDNEAAMGRIVDICNENENVIIDCYEKVDFIEMFKRNAKRVMYHYPVTTFNDLKWFLAFNPYAVTIGEPLTFELQKVRDMVNQQLEYTRIRVLAAIGRPSEWNVISHMIDDNGVKHFWILPHTIYLYEPFIDTIDLYDRDKEREVQLVKVYLSGECDWPMNVLLKNCDVGTPCGMVMEDVIERRLNCGQRCMQGGNRCDLCNRETKLINSVIVNHS